MDAERWQELVDALQEETRTEVQLPRFELTYERELNDVLKAMGMEVAFDQSRADFGWLLEDAGGAAGAHIGRMKQKGFLSVDEEGTDEVPPVAVPLPMLDPEPSVVPGVGAS